MDDIMTTNDNSIKRGDIYYVDLPEQPAWSHIQSGRRPCVVVQNNNGNIHSPNTIVIPLTTKHKVHLPTHFIVKETPKTSLGLAEAIVTVNKADLVDYLGHISREEEENMKESLMVCLAL